MRITFAFSGYCHLTFNVSYVYFLFRIAELLELGEGVIAMDPAEVLGEVAHSDIERCSIEQRPIFMRGIELDQGGSFISDLFIQTGSLFNPSQKVTLRCVQL